jgi:orotate phosphoribosyltransferase
MIPSTYPDDATMAQMTARMLLDIRAVHFDTDTLFTHASGKQAPTYIDCRKLISHPRIRSTTMDFLTCKVMRAAGLEAFDNIAGGETAGIPFAALVAERMALPMSYVRKKPKGYGRAAQIEGEMPEGARVLLVEDLTTDGGSKLKFVDAIRAAGATCAHTGGGLLLRDLRGHARPAGRSRPFAALALHLGRCHRRGPPRGRFRRGDAGRRGAIPRGSGRLARRARAGLGRCPAGCSWRVANLTHSCYPNLNIAWGSGRNSQHLATKTAHRLLTRESD